MYSIGKGSNARTFCTREIFSYVGFYISNRKDLGNVELVFDRGLMDKYLSE